jgi:hypothetical protein
MQPYPPQQYGDPNAGNGQGDPGLYAQPAAPQGYDAQGYAGTPYAGPQAPQAPLNTEQLEQLVAPIALYPDTVVAQVLAASTYPAQVVDADHWRQAQGNAPPELVVAGANAQSWDPSLKALTAFPQLLAEMDENIRWTIALGNAYYNQPQDVLDVVQVMRQRAEAAGNLQSSPEEAVTYDQGYIQVAPVNPEVVYLPYYDPWAVYGQPIQPYRGFSLVGALGSFFNSGFASGAVRFGLGIAMSAFNHTPFGLLGWGLDWLTHTLLYHNSGYFSHSTTVADWGLPHGGPRAFGQRYGNSNAFGGDRENGFRSHGGYGYHQQRAQTYARPGENGYARYGENRAGIANGYRGDGYTPRGVGNSYGRTGMEAYNRSPEAPRSYGAQPVARPQQFSRPTTVYGNGYAAPGYGARSYGGPAAGFASRPSPVFNRPQEAFRGAAPAQQFNQRAFAERPSSGFSNRGFEEGRSKPEKSGGMHLFGGGGHEPKAPKMDKHFGGGGHSDKGHSGGHGGGHHR